MLANLFSTLVNKSLLQRAQCLEGLGKFLQGAIDLTCDIPKIWDYLGEIVGKPLITIQKYLQILLVWSLSATLYNRRYRIATSRNKHFIFSFSTNAGK